MGTIINMIRINFLISANYLLVVEKLNNGLNGRLFKLSGSMPIVELIKINLFTSYNHIYLMIEVKFKTGEY
jgi:hypothetical protein